MTMEDAATNVAAAIERAVVALASGGAGEEAVAVDVLAHARRHLARVKEAEAAEIGPHRAAVEEAKKTFRGVIELLDASIATLKAALVERMVARNETHLSGNFGGSLVIRRYVRFDPSRSRLDVLIAEAARLPELRRFLTFNEDALNEACRRGGTLDVPGCEVREWWS